MLFLSNIDNDITWQIDHTIHVFVHIFGKIDSDTKNAGTHLLEFWIAFFCDLKYAFFAVVIHLASCIPFSILTAKLVWPL